MEVGYDVATAEYVSGKRAGLLAAAQMLLDCATLAHRCRDMDLSNESMLYTWRYQDVMAMVTALDSGAEPSKEYCIAGSGICGCGELMDGHSGYENHSPTEQMITMSPNTTSQLTELTELPPEEFFINDI